VGLHVDYGRDETALVYLWQVCPLSSPIYVPVMFPYLSKPFPDTWHSRTVSSRRSKKITAVPRRSLNLFGPFKGLRTCP